MKFSFQVARLDDHEPYVQARANTHRLKTELADLKAQLQSRAAIFEGPATPSHRMVSHLVGGGTATDLDVNEEEVGPPLRELGTKIRAVERAITIAAKNERDARNAAIRGVVDSAKGELRKLTAVVVQAAGELAYARLTLDALRAAVDSSGVDPDVLGPIWPQGVHLDSPREAGGHFQNWLKELVESDLLSGDEPWLPRPEK